MPTNVSDTRPATSSCFAPVKTTIPRSTMIILVVLVFTAFVMMINETTLAVALPSIMAQPNLCGHGPVVTHRFLAHHVRGAHHRLVGRPFQHQVVFIFATPFLAGTITAALAPSFGLLLMARVYLEQSAQEW